MVLAASAGPLEMTNATAMIAASEIARLFEVLAVGAAR